MEMVKRITKGTVGCRKGLAIEKEQSKVKEKEIQEKEHSIPRVRYKGSK